MYEECEGFYKGMHKKVCSIDNKVKKVSLYSADRIKFVEKSYTVWLNFRSTHDIF